MRPIDADALKELFSEVIGRIAIKPEMNGNLEHMIRASTMVIQMIDDAPSIQPEREKGEWVYNSPVTMKCNRCGLVIKDWDWHRFKICPNCGAKMESGEADE